MGQQQLAGQFPSQQLLANTPGTNLVDGQTAGISQWSRGATIAFPIPIQPPLAEPWSLTAWTISLYGLTSLDLGNFPQFGRFGRLIGGAFHGGQPIAGVSTPWKNPIQQLPSETAALTTLWDGANDPPFPQQTALAQQTLTPLLTTFPLPIPLELDTGTGLSLGLWLTPSLTANAGIMILGAAYTLIIDDGKPRLPGWGGP